MTDFSWLIEVSGPYYLSVLAKTSGDAFVWTKDHNKAIRFFSKDQANDVMMAIRELKRDLFIFPTGEEPRPVEHGWFTESSEALKTGFTDETPHA